MDWDVEIDSTSASASASVSNVVSGQRDRVTKPGERVMECNMFGPLDWAAELLMMED